MVSRDILSNSFKNSELKTSRRYIKKIPNFKIYQQHAHCAGLCGWSYYTEWILIYVSN